VWPLVQFGINARVFVSVRDYTFFLLEVKRHVCGCLMIETIGGIVRPLWLRFRN